MLHMGNHMKLTLPHSLRERCRSFYAGICECAIMDSPRPDLDLYRFHGGFVLGIFFAGDAEILPVPEYIKAAWLELKVDDVPAYRQRLLDFGIEQLPYEDVSRFYFQAPGGQVFRLAPLDGGI